MEFGAINLYFYYFVIYYNYTLFASIDVSIRNRFTFLVFVEHKLIRNIVRHHFDTSSNAGNYRIGVSNKDREKKTSLLKKILEIWYDKRG